MDQMEQKLGAILSDPASMSKIMELAKGLGLNPSSTPAAGNPPPSASQSPQPSGQEINSSALGAPQAGSQGASQAAAQPSQSPLSALGGNPLSMMLSAMGNQVGDDKQTLLLKALRPYLKAERQERLDRAIQTAKMVRIAKQAMKQFTP